MYDGGRILIGLVIFLAIVTSPMWYQLVQGAEKEPPELVYPANSKECVASAEQMRALHMDMLNEWRDDVVRRGDRNHIGPDGKVYDKSLSRTCMKCHSNKAEFCDQCHNYVDVSPYCWDCHVEPKEKQ